MRLLSSIVSLLVLLVLARGDEGEKRVTDSPRASIRGGGKLGGSLQGRKGFVEENLSLGTASDPESLLLQVDDSAVASVSEAYSFLLDKRFADCYEDDQKGQGAECNSCWAFASKNMFHARRCRAHILSGQPWVPSDQKVSPLNMICNMQTGEICQVNTINDALDSLIDTGLVKWAWLEKLKKQLHKFDDESDSKRVAIEIKVPGNSEIVRLEVPANPDEVIDVSKPLRDYCKFIFFTNAYRKNLVPASEITFSSAPHTNEKMRARLVSSGPVVGTIRLTWEFQNFAGSLFNPAGKMTFCRLFRPKDPNDYCSPENRAKWDAAQLEQQTTLDDTTWYNHFVTVHGWGVKKFAGPGGENVPYWVVENSWGRIYDNDASLGNNGAGKRYDPLTHLSGSKKKSDAKKKGLVNKNHFLLIAQRVAGAGHLELTSREVYAALL
jgi:hypothetical protein